MEKKISIAIDGPAAAGKSTVAKNLAAKLSIVYIDTGAMYRALTYKALQNQVDIHKEDEIAALLDKTIIRLYHREDGQRVLLDDEDVTEVVRSEKVSNAVSYVASHQKVREHMVKEQQNLANNISVIMDGRDIGTHVLPNAEVKIYLIASVVERAERRHKENLAKGEPSDLNELIEDIRNRDERDMTREISPLVKADDAISIDTTSMSIDEVMEKILHIVLEYQHDEEKK
ncbi:MAG TPA: (d)CMP kinase [Pseudogracilibacillus sp.]|nr:(d)CMP kinase [Pseudogracilibacillus sp.]